MEIKSKVIPNNLKIEALVFEREDIEHFSLVRYTKLKGKKIYNPHLQSLHEYNEMFMLTQEEKIDELVKIAGTDNFKIRTDLFTLLFNELCSKENQVLPYMM